jgi:hypothetical protein
MAFATCTPAKPRILERHTRPAHPLGDFDRQLGEPPGAFGAVPGSLQALVAQQLAELCGL